MERINDKENRSIYDRMIEKKKKQIEEFRIKINELINLEETVKKRRKVIKENIDMLDSIIAEGAISNVNLRLLIQEIQVLELENDELAIVIAINTPFGEYGEVFDADGNVTLAHRGNYKPIPPYGAKSVKRCRDFCKKVALNLPFGETVKS